MYIDSHCHLDFNALRQDLPRLLNAAAQASITAIVIPGVCPEQWLEARTLVTTLSPLSLNSKAERPRLYSAAGLHPWWIDGYLQAAETGPAVARRLECELRAWIVEQDPIALGECGLDGAIDTPLELQQRLFECQLRLAAEFSLPLILHVRRCHNEVIRCLDALGSGKVKGVVHGFSGSEQQAREYWRRGFALGVGGAITYERAKKTRRAFAELPLEALMLETDAPDMPLSGYQGQVNTPLQLPEVAQVLADLRGLAMAQVAEQTSINTRRVFNLPAESMLST